MNATKSGIAATVVAALLAAAPISAQVVNGPNVGGYSTFRDVHTGRVWLDLDNFFGLTPRRMFQLAASAGFALATRTDLDNLFSNLPLSTFAQWSSYDAIMGGAPNRNLIWGFFDVGDPTNTGWAFAYDFSSTWDIDPNTGFGWDFVPNAGTPYADMNIWAFQLTPEPASLALVATGLAGVAMLRRNRRKT